MYENGFIGRTTVEVMGADNYGMEAMIPVDSLVIVMDGGKVLGDEPDSQRYNIVLLTNKGKLHKRNISYDGCWDGMLTPEPGVIGWSRDKSAQAVAQGWEIFFCEGSDDPLWQLQAVMGSEEYQTTADALVISDRFKSDQDAWRFVWNRAVKADCSLAKDALAFLYYRCLARGVRKDSRTLCGYATERKTMKTYQDAVASIRSFAEQKQVELDAAATKGCVAR